MTKKVLIALFFCAATLAAQNQTTNPETLPPPEHQVIISPAPLVDSLAQMPAGRYYAQFAAAFTEETYRLLSQKKTPVQRGWRIVIKPWMFDLGIEVYVFKPEGKLRQVTTIVHMKEMSKTPAKDAQNQARRIADLILSDTVPVALLPALPDQQVGSAGFHSPTGIPSIKLLSPENACDTFKKL